MKAVIILLIGLVYCNSSGAKPPIEGGSKFDYDNPDPLKYFVQRIKTPRACTATQISDEWFITAAHCTHDPESFDYSATIEFREVVSVYIHPKYKELRKRLNTNSIYSCEGCSEVDVALIKVRETSTFSGKKFIPIINDKTAFDHPRKKIKLAGYGANKLNWNGKEWDGSPSYDLYIGSNEWISCSQLAGNAPLESQNKLAKQIEAVLSFEARRTHVIKENGAEDIMGQDNASALPGDSGGPIFEKDKNGLDVITGIVVTMGIVAENPRINIINKKTRKTITVDISQEMIKADSDIENWGKSDKKNSEFPIVKTILKKHGAIDSSGKVSSSFEIERVFDRYIQNEAVNLASPEVQDFLKKTMN